MDDPSNRFGFEQIPIEPALAAGVFLVTGYHLPFTKRG